MNKESRVLLVLAGAVLVNTALFFAVFMAFMAFYVFFLSNFFIEDESLFPFSTPCLIILFAASLAISFLIYRVILNKLRGKLLVF